MSKRKYFIILILAITAMLCMVGASTWIVTSPSALTPTWDKGKNPLWVKRYAEFDYTTGGIALAENNNLTDKIEFCDENGPVDISTAVESVNISSISVSNGDITVADKKITVGSTYRVDGISIQLKDDYQLVGTYTTDSNIKDTIVYYTDRGSSNYQLDGLLLKYKTVYEGTPANKGSTYYTIEDALSNLNGTISVEKGSTSFTALSDTFTGYSNSGRSIETGKTLLIPRSDDDTGATNVINAGSKIAYATLILPTAVNMNVNGTLTVNASRSSTGGATSIIQSHGLLEVNKGAHIEIAPGATWHCLGYSYGDGTVNVASGATVYETFSMPGWKGGTISASVRGTVFPLNQFSVNGIICRTTFNAGCVYRVQAFFTASSANFSPEVDFITSGSSSFLQLTSGSIDKYIEEDTGKIHFEVNGAMTFRNIAIEFKLGFSITVSTNNLQVPLPGNFVITLNSGTATIPSGVQVKLLRGATLNVNKNATLIVNGGAYAYGDGNVTMDTVEIWQDGNNKVAYPRGDVTGCYRKTPKLDYTATTPAKVTIAGKLTVNNGAKVGGYFDGISEGQITLNGTITGNSFKEDYSTSDDCSTGSTVFGSGGKFFTSTFSTKGPIWNGDQKTVGDFQKGVWVFTDGAWKQADTSNSITVHVQYDAGDGTFADGQHTHTEDLTMFVENVSEGGTIDYALAPGETPSLPFYSVDYWYYLEGDTKYKLEERPFSVHNNDTLHLYADWTPIDYAVTLIVQPAGMTAEQIAATLGTETPLIEIIEGSWNIEASSSLNSYIERMKTLLSAYDNTFVLGTDVYLAADLTNLDGLQAITELSKDTLAGADLSSQYGIILVCRATQTLTFNVVYDYSGIPDDTDHKFETDGLNNRLVENFNGTFGDLISKDTKFDGYDYDISKEYYFAGWYVSDSPIAMNTSVAFEHLTQVDGNYTLTLVAKWEKKATLTINLIDQHNSWGGALVRYIFTYSNENGENKTVENKTTAGGKETKNDTIYIYSGQTWKLEAVVDATSDTTKTYSSTNAKNKLQMGSSYSVTIEVTANMVGAAVPNISSDTLTEEPKS